MIEDHHIDVFVGVGKHNPFAFVTSKASETFTAHVLHEDEAGEAHRRLAAAHRAPSAGSGR